MQLSLEKIKKLCTEKGCTVQQLLHDSAVSKNALYSLARKNTILPRSVHAIAKTLNVPASALLTVDSLADNINDIIRRAAAITGKHKKADPDTIRHTLILLQEEPLDRLRRSLLRGGKFIFTDSEISFLRDLVRQNVDFMIVGLSAAALQGAPVVTKNIELCFKYLASAGIKKALKKVSGAYVPPSAINTPMFAGEAVKLFDIVVHMPGLNDFEQEKNNALTVRLADFDIAVLSLERIIQSKKVTGRAKDKLVLPVLKDALTAIKESSKK